MKNLFLKIRKPNSKKHISSSPAKLTQIRPEPKTSEKTALLQRRPEAEIIQRGESKSREATKDARDRDFVRNVEKVFVVKRSVIVCHVRIKNI